MKNYREMLDYNDVYDFLHRLKMDDSLTEPEYQLVKLIYTTVINMPRQSIGLDSHWDFVVNEERMGYWKGELTALYYNGYKCSNCGNGGGESTPCEYGEMTEDEAKVFFSDMNYRFCPNCGARMVNGK